MKLFLLVLIVAAGFAPYIRAEETTRNAIYDAWKVVDQQPNEMSKLQGPETFKPSCATHEDELKADAKVLANNRVAGTLDLVHEIVRLEVRSFDNTLSDSERAFVKKDIAADRLKLITKVRARLDQVSTSEN